MSAKERGGGASDPGVKAKRLILAASCLGISLSILRSTSINTALPAVRADLGGSVTGLQWVVGGYTLVLGSLLLSAGALSDRFGARRAFLIGLVAFAFFAALSALAPSLPYLIALQVPLGVGAALMGPPSLALINEAFAEPSERARAVGVWAATLDLAVPAGPVLGGLGVGAVGWRGLFLLAAPTALAVAVVIYRYVSEAAPQGQRGLDPVGQVTGILALLALTAALIEAGQLGWSSSFVLGSLAVFALCAAAFVVVERREERRGGSPMVHPSLFGSPVLSAGTFAGLLVTFCTFGQVFVLTLYFGDSLGYSIAFTGLAFLPLAALTFAASLVSGRLTERIGLRAPLVSGLALAGLGSLLLLAVGEHSSYTLFLAELSLVGIGGGFAIPPATEAVVSSAPDEKAGIASAVVNASRQTGGVLGVALLGSLSGNEIVAGPHTAGFVCAGSFLVGAALSLAYVRRAGESPPEEEREEAKEEERGS